MTSGPLRSGSRYCVTSVPHTPATSTRISAASSGTGGRSSSRSSVVEGPTFTAARVFSAIRLKADCKSCCPLSQRRTMAPVGLTLACWNYDRTRALADGRVRPDGIDVNYVSLPVEETFFRMMRHREFDAAELSLSSYVLSLFEPEPPFVAIPVFPSRSFRHSCIYVHAASGIRCPKDLVGKRVGSPEFQLTACVWIRGILADQHEVPVESVTHVIGGQEQSGRIEKTRLALPESIRIERIGPADTLASTLEPGDIDALYTPRIPSTFRRAAGRVTRP